METDQAAERSFIRIVVRASAMSRAFGAVLAVALAAGGCRHDNSGATEVVFWALGAEGEHVQKLMPEFERRNPEIRVRVQMIPWNAAHEKLLTAYAGGSLPDMAQIGNTWLPEFRLLGAIEDLGPWMARSASLNDSAYFPGIWSTNLIDGHLMGVPWYVDTRVLFYRRDLLERIGYRHPPVSWEEWFDVCDRLVHARQAEYGILLPTNNEWAPAVIMGLQKRSTLLKENFTRGNFRGAEFVDALRSFHRFFERGWAPRQTTQIINVYQGFSDAQYAMYITGPWNIGEFSRRLPPEQQHTWMTAPMPGPDGEIGVSLAGGSSLTMFTSSNHKEAVWKVVEFLSEPAQQAEFYRLTGDLPARVAAWKDSALANNPYAQAFFVQLGHVVATPQVPEWEQIAQKVREFSELVAMDRLTVEAAAAGLDRSVDVMLEKRRWMVHGK
jgi:multiple sugar transport system substrate-binding protein